MSPHAANSLVHDLVQMAQAMEQLPQVREELESANGTIETLRSTVQRLEMKIMDYKGEADTFRATVRDLEVARDDAELRFLEAEERTTRALDFIKATFGNAGSLIQALEPPKIEITPETFSVSTDSITPQPAKDESASPLPDTPMPNSSEHGSGIQADQASQIGSPGQSEPDPLPTSGAKATPDGSGSDATSHVVDTALVTPISEAAPPSHGPYHNRRYIDVPYYVSLDNWTAGGGTVDDYYANRAAE